MADKQYLTAAEAAAVLGVQVATIYAYVSRGLIRSEAAAGASRQKRYRREDVLALQERQALRGDPARALAAALHFGAPLLESGICLIQEGRLYYRGYDVVGLAGARSFEEVAALLWTGEPDGGLIAGALPALPLPPELLAQWAGLRPSERLSAALPLAAASDQAAYNLAPAAVVASGGRILQLLAAILAGPTPAGGERLPLARRLQAAWAPGAAAVAPLLNGALILCADHELNISSFTARCVASAGATPYAVVQAGLAALSGSKHGGYTERVEALFDEVGQPARAAAVVASRLRRGEGVPGFGHPLYPNGDPRGRLLLTEVARRYPESPAVKLVGAVTAAVAAATGQQPNIDVALVALARAAGLPAGAPLALFALGRSAGWIGHALEEYERGQLIRPRARYTGPMPLEY